MGYVNFEDGTYKRKLALDTKDILFRVIAKANDFLDGIDKINYQINKKKEDYYKIRNTKTLQEYKERLTKIRIYLGLTTENIDSLTPKEMRNKVKKFITKQYRRT